MDTLYLLLWASYQQLGILNQVAKAAAANKLLRVLKVRLLYIWTALSLCCANQFPLLSLHIQDRNESDQMIPGNKVDKPK